MEHLSRTTLQCPTHLHHPAAGVNAGEKTKLAQSLAQSLFAHRNTLGPSHLLGHLIADDRIQEQIIACHPTDSRALRYTTPASLFVPPAPLLSLGRRLPARVRPRAHVRNSVPLATGLRSAALDCRPHGIWPA